MKRLLVRGILLLLPLFFLLIAFVALDPFYLVNQPSSPVLKGVLMNDRLFQYRVLEKTEQNFDSFIFGSSRSKAFKTLSWNNYINSTKSFHLGVNDESIYGIEKKIEYLNQKGNELKNVLLILDHRILSLTHDHDAHIFREHPMISGKSLGEYYKMYFLAFLKPEFIHIYYRWMQTKEYTEDMNKYIFKEDFFYHQQSGDIDYIGYEESIKKDSFNYYQINKYRFYDRQQNSSIQIINGDALEELKKIKTILLQKKTNVKIIITPNYDQVKISAKDLEILRNIFGEENVIDFTGKNEITEYIGNYYEEKHFKPFIANQLMSKAYTKKNEGK